MSRWRIMLEAALLYVGGLSLGGFAGYEFAVGIRDQTDPQHTNPFSGDDAILTLGIIAVFLVAGPFLLHALTAKWRLTTCPVLVSCGLIVVAELAYLVYVLLMK